MVSVIIILLQPLGTGYEGLLPAQASAAFLQYLSSLLEPLNLNAHIQNPVNNGEQATPVLCQDPFPPRCGWRSPRGAWQPEGVLDSPGDGSFVFHCACSPVCRRPRSWLGRPAPLMRLTRPSHSLDTSPAWGPGGAAYPVWGWVAPAPAARPLANSDYFSFSCSLGCLYS